MKLYVIRDPVQYSLLSTEMAQENLAKLEGWDYRVFYAEDIRKGIVDKDSAPLVLMFHAAQLKLNHLTTRRIREIFPNAKLICLGTDTIVYRRGHAPPFKHEVNTPYEIDLWADTLTEVLEDYDKLGIKTVRWRWTASHKMLAALEAATKERSLEKNRDFIALFKLNSKYRRNLLYNLQNVGFTTIGTGEVGWDISELQAAYAVSKFALGTTSSSWNLDDVRTMKGFRDWIAPACGTVVLYDNHPDILKYYEACPTYSYDNTYDLIKLYRSIDELRYQEILEAQRSWAARHILEQQFKDMLWKL